MADDTLNEGSEEEKKSSDDSFSDDDFGLPDLEFDDLEELDMSGDSESEPSTDDAGGVEETPEPPAVEFDMSLVEDAPDPMADLGSGLQEGDLDPPETTALNEGMDEVEDVLDSAQLISDRLGDEEDAPALEDTPSLESTSPLADFEESAPEASEPVGGSLFEAESEEEPKEDLFAGIDSPDDLAALGMADEDEVPGAEPVESGGSLFAADEDDEESIFGSGGGLAMEEEEKDEFEPAGDSELPPNYKAYSYEESSGGFTKIVVIGIILIAVVAGGLLWMNSKDEGEKKPVAKKETKTPAKKPPVKKNPTPTTEASESAAKSNAAAAAKTPAVKKTAAKKPAASKPKPAAAATATPGDILKISERTARSYVIVGSFIDEDLAMDYANKLSGEGKGVKVIQPYGKSKRYRVSVADYPTYGDAASQLDSFKGEYGDQVWALKY